MILRMLSVLLLTAGLLCGPPASRDARAGEVSTLAAFPEGLRRGLDHLLQVSCPRGDRQLRSAEIGALLDAVAAGSPVALAPEAGSDAACAHGRFEIRRSLADIVRFGYSPDIPSHLLMPSSVRVARWTEVDGQPGRPLPRLWPLVPGLRDPVVVRGIERVENTPDPSSGAYFAYDLERALILLRHQGRLFLISVSIQKDVSEVGRRGAVIGADGDWNYLYFEEEGLDRPGLGWVRSHMYAGGSVSVYAQIDGARPLVRLGIFRWLKAGWASINMVRRSHIEAGLERYADTLRRIIEHPHLPDGDTLAAGLAQIYGLSDALLAERTRSYFQNLADTGDARLAPAVRERLDRLVADGPALHLNRDSMAALLAVQYLKALLGKPTGPEISGLDRGPDHRGRG